MLTTYSISLRQAGNLLFSGSLGLYFITAMAFVITGTAWLTVVAACLMAPLVIGARLLYITESPVFRRFR